MAKIHKKLASFIGNECAYACSTDESCYVNGRCCVLEGQRCSYFENCLLIPESPKPCLSGDGYNEILYEYESQTKDSRRKPYDLSEYVKVTQAVREI